MTAESDKRLSLLHRIAKIVGCFLVALLPVWSIAQTTIDNTATGTSIPTGWSSTNAGGALNVQQSGYYLLESATAPVYDYLLSNIYSTINGASSVTIYFDIATYGSGTNSPVKVDMSVNGGSTWTSTQTSGATPTSPTYVSTNVTFTGPISSTSVQFRFYDGIAGDKAVRIKNIVIHATFPTCTMPATPVATSATNITSSSFTANWNAQTDAAGYYVDVYQKTNTTITVTEGFNSGTTAPSGWTFTTINGTYTSAGNYGASSPSLQMDATNDAVVTPSLPSAATALSFWIKGNGTNAVSALLVEGYNGSGWATIQNITASIPTTGTTYTYNASSSPALPANITQFRFTYTKGAGNIAFDDVSYSYTGLTTSYVSGWQNVYTTDNFLDVSGLSANSTYYYVVRAVSGGCTTTNSNEISTTTSSACTPTATVTSFTPTSATAGSTVTITGTGFTTGTGVSLIRFGTASTTSFTVVNSTTITVTVPAAATSGVIRVTSNGCDAVSASNFSVLSSTGGMDIKIKTQFVNPCGADANNEFVLGSTLTNSVNIGNLALTSTNGTDVNYYWYGKNLPSNPYTNSVFSSGTSETCGDAGLHCFRLLDPGTPADATIINGVISQLNSIAGCTVFLAVPASGDIPAQSNVIFFLGAGGCGFDNASAYVNFSNHCDPSTGTAYNQYYVVVGTGDYGCNGGGYFSNSSSRASTLYNYLGGGNTVSSNYQSQTTGYTTPPSLNVTQNTTGSQAAVFVPDGQGGSKWVSNKGCIPPPYILLSRFTFNLNATKSNRGVWLHIEFNAKDALNEFVIEKSTDNEVFTPVTVIKAYDYKPGTDIELEYTDKEALGRITYYRVRAVSLKELTYYSSICKIVEGQSATTKIFPNPADHELFVSSYTNETVQFDIVASNGAMLLSGSLRNQTKRINIQKLNHGVYIIRFYSTNGVLLKSEKFMKQ